MYKVTADLIWLLHFCVLVVALFGWLFPQLWYLYTATLLAVLVSNIFLDHCFLSKWEFDLRKLVNPKIDYDYKYTSYYTYNLTKGYLSRSFLRWAGLSFTSLSLVINLYFRFFF